MVILLCPKCGNKYYIDELDLVISATNLKCPKCQAFFYVTKEEATLARDIRPNVPNPIPPASKISSVSKIVSKGKKILVVDDEVFFRKLISDILVSNGYDIIEAQDGEDALIRIKHELPDLIITDLLLPKLTGFDLLKEVRKGELGKNIPVLVVTSVYKDTSHIIKLQGLGADDFIDKAFKPAQLLSRVDKLLSKIK
ncbi:MAG: response regulator [bacterium]